MFVEKDREEWKLYDQRGGDDPLIVKSIKGEFFLYFIGYFTQLYLNELPGNFLTIHSAGLLYGQKAIIFFGSPDAGKTTAAYRLLEKKNKFLSDEYVTYNPEEGQIITFPRPLNFGIGGHVQKPFKTFSVPVNDGDEYVFGLPPQESMCRSSVTPQQIFLVELRRNSPDQKLTPISPGKGLIRLFPHTRVSGSSEKKFKLLSSFVRENASIYSLHYREIEEARTVIEDLLE